MWCAYRRISSAEAEEAWLQGVCRENTGGETPSKQKSSLPKKAKSFCLAEQVGFEPTGLERLTDFESASL